MKRLLSIIIFVLCSLISINHGFAEQSMRRCMLLPILDSVGGAISFGVFENIEEYLKESDWCYYKSNSEILNILGQYKNNLSTHLDNAEVLRIVAEKTKVGSLIKIDIINQVNGANIKIRVIGENGRDIYFKESTLLNTTSTVIIAQTIKNWLDVYEKNIPYDGRITGILGNQITIDIGKTAGVSEEDEFFIKRRVKKKKHPLLKEIVDWDTTNIAKGTIFHSIDNQSYGKISEYYDKKRPLLEDWISVRKSNKVFSVGPSEKFASSNQYQFGKLGEIGISLSIVKGSETISSVLESTKKLGGYLLGVDLDLELWITRYFWASIEINKNFGKYSRKEGDLYNASNSIDLGIYKYKAGYRYLPLGFFYGPKVDVYLGYGKYSYGLDNKLTDGVTETKFKGLLIGAEGNMPIKKVYRLFVNLDFIIKPKYTEELTIYGENDSTSAYSLALGGNYAYSPNMKLESSLVFSASKAKFKEPSREVAFKNTALKLGAIFTF